MILYLDTTAFVKLFVQEESSDVVRAQLAAVDVVATSRVAYSEACDALARRVEQGRLSVEQLNRVRDEINAAWPQFAVLDLDEQAASDITLKHGLRGYAAVHLASALELRDKAEDVPVVFCSFDQRQVNAAEAEGLAVLAH